MKLFNIGSDLMIYENILETIGKTPLVKLHSVNDSNAKILAKIEFFNPGGSIKDRPALEMIERAEREGVLKRHSVIVEPTSGNTGIGLAMVSAVKGYKIILTMPDTLSIERMKLLKAYGAELVLTPGEKGMRGAIETAFKIAEKYENSFIPMQFKNTANVEAHRKTTAIEIWNDTEGNIDAFVAGVGTGGTITGVGKFLKEKNKNIKIFAVEPEDSPVLSGGKPGIHKIQGIGAGFIPNIVDQNIIDEVMTVSNEDAFEMSRRLAKEEGILAGISAGAAVKVAVELGYKNEYHNKTIVAIIPDTGERYLSTPLFS